MHYANILRHPMERHFLLYVCTTELKITVYKVFFYTNASTPEGLY